MKQKESNIFNYLISNKSFIDWVKDPTETRQYFWKKWIDEHPENVDEIIRAKKFVQSLKFKEKELSAGELDEVFGKIIKNQKSSSYSESNREKVGYFLFGNPVRIAASVSIFILSSFLLLWIGFTNPEAVQLSENQPIQWVEVVTARGERKEIILPDSSVVNLNYESSLRYPSQFSEAERVIEFTGEAFFDVTHDKERPFKVITQGIETKVLGTTFNINSYMQESDIKISLVTGRVEVTKLAPAQQEVNQLNLAPGEEMSFEKSTEKMIINQFDVAPTIAWKDGVLIFKNVGFEEFIDRLEKWYNVNFQVFGPYPKDWGINGRYEKEELENILIGVKFVYDIDYSIQGNNVTLKFK